MCIKIYYFNYQDKILTILQLFKKYFLFYNLIYFIIKAGEIVLLVFASIICALGAGCCSGLNLGMMALNTDYLKMQVNQKSDPQKAKYAKKLLPLLEDKHILLGAILLGNGLFAELLPIVLETLVGDIWSIVISITVVVIFCEILPQAIFIKYQMKACSFLTWFMWIFIFCFFIILWPLARLLDCISGKDEGYKYSRDEIQEFLLLHGDESTSISEISRFSSNDQEDDQVEQEKPKSDQLIFSNYETQIIKGIFNTYEEPIKSCKIRYFNDKIETQFIEDQISSCLSDINDFSSDDVEQVEKETGQMLLSGMVKALDYNSYIIADDSQQIPNTKCVKLSTIINDDFTRYPVFLNQTKCVIGLVNINQLLIKQFNLPIAVKDLEMTKIINIPSNITVVEGINAMRSNKVHLAVITDHHSFNVLGITSIEDLYEYMLNTEIYDEFDNKQDEVYKLEDILNNKLLSKQIKVKIDVKKLQKLQDQLEQKRKELEDNSDDLLAES